MFRLNVVHVLNSKHAGYFSCLLTFFKINFFKKNLSGTLSECQTVLTQIRTDIISVLIWIQTVFKGYQHITTVATSMEKVKENVDHVLKLRVCTKKYFSYFSTKTYFVGTQQNPLNEMVLLSTQNIC